MKNAIVVSLAMLAAVPSGAAVSLVETELEFPTYAFSDPDPVPCTESPLYPYFRFDGSTDRSVAQKWRAVILENEKIKVTILPEIGGKVWGAEDKQSGRAFLYYNHVVKFRNIALRGPWCSGGIEFNFGITGHSPVSATPVDWFTRRNADGSVSYFAAANEYINRTTWQVEVRLAPGAEHFSTHTTWFNAANLPGPYYQWMNAAFPLDKNTEFVFPGRNYVGHAGDAHAWPVDSEGRDLSVYAENVFGGNKSYHVVNGDNRIFGLWWPDFAFGAVHRNPPYDKFGRKIWLWSPSREGGIWEDLLTDNDGQYAELQSGRAFQQPCPPCEQTPFKIPSFAPGGTDVFDETWGLVRNRDDYGRPEMDITPRPVKMPEDFDWNSAQGLALKGVQMLRTRNNDDGAKRLLEDALAVNRYYVPALDALAGIEARRAHYAEALALAQRALAVDTYDGEANYLAGFAALGMNDLPTAKERLGLAAFSPSERSAAYSLLAMIALRERDWAEADKLAERALLANGLSLDARLARIVARRKAGDAAIAAKFAREILDKFPLFHAARYELGKVGGKEDFRVYVRCEFPHETMADIATWYESAGLLDEARELFGFAGERPLALLRLAWIDRDAAALGRIARLPTAFAFPFRREAKPALEWAARENKSWIFKWYFGLFLAANGDDAQAGELLAVCGNEPEDSAFYLYRADRNIGMRRYADLLEAEKRGGGWRAGMRRFECETASGDFAAALTTAEKYIGLYPDVNAVKLGYAKALLKAKRSADCVKYLESVRILPSEYGENANGIWQEACYSLGENEKADSWPENLGAGKPYELDNRPYEFKRANRTKDDVEPLCGFEDGSKWEVATEDAAAKCELTREEQLFGKNTLRLSFCGKGENPVVRFGPTAAKPLPDVFDTIYVWVKGNCFGRGANTDFSVPSPTLEACFRTADGAGKELALGKIDWPDWHQMNLRLTDKEIAALKGGAFIGFALKGGRQPDYRQIHLDDFSIFKDDITMPFEITARPQRNLKPLKGAVQGVNTGDGSLPFPNREETIIPVTPNPKNGDLTPVFNGGAVKNEEAKELVVTRKKSGKSLVVDFYAPAGKVTEVSAGTASEAKVVKSFKVPYLAYGDGEGRIRVELLEGGWYRSSVFDWCRSNASKPGFADGAFTMQYVPRTDGTYNPVSERLVITVSRDFAEVLPEIPNPVSPFKKVTGKNAWRSHASYDHAFDKAFWKEVRKHGIEHVVINDHETIWRDRGESFTFRTEAAPKRGGDSGADEYSRFIRSELGYIYGPYNNYTDFSPMNEHWSRNLISRRADGSLCPAWVRCYAPKPVLAPTYCEQIVPKAQSKFAFNTAYCDVHTATTPYARTDYDARVPGAATFAQTFYAWGELMLLQKKHWKGPVYSEGGRHFYYAGLADGNYAQDRGYDFISEPWIVDFDLLKIHPKECDFGMGTLSMFSPGKTQEEIRYYLPHAPTEKDRDELVDLFLTATVAFGHAPFLILDYCFTPPKPFGLAYGGGGRLDFEKGIPVALKSYAMIQPIAARYTQTEVKSISYFNASGTALSSSAAIASGDVARNQIFVEYQDGTCVVANGNKSERLKAKVKGNAIDLPPRAFKAWTRDGKVRAEISEGADGKRDYYSECPEFTYKEGKLTKKTPLFRGIYGPSDPMPDDRAKALGSSIVRIEEVKEITAEKLNELARRSGARVYSDPGNVTYVGNGVACVHRIAGPATVDFGREVTPVDPLTGRTAAPIRYWKPDTPRHGVAAICYTPVSRL